MHSSLGLEGSGTSKGGTGRNLAKFNVRVASHAGRKAAVGDRAGGRGRLTALRALRHEIRLLRAPKIKYKPTLLPGLGESGCGGLWRINRTSLFWQIIFPWTLSVLNSGGPENIKID
jgi:hypothetical protein